MADTNHSTTGKGDNPAGAFGTPRLANATQGSGQKTVSDNVARPGNDNASPNSTKDTGEHNPPRALGETRGNGGSTATGGAVGEPVKVARPGGSQPAQGR